jgi:hypothetical protein
MVGHTVTHDPEMAESAYKEGLAGQLATQVCVDGSFKGKLPEHVLEHVQVELNP